MRISNLHEFWFTSKDGLRIACKQWDSRGPARGVLQIAHGMGEHRGRYCELIDALLEASFTVYANDHRGHGRTAASPQNFGDFGEGGFALLVEDMVELTRFAKRGTATARPAFATSLAIFAKVGTTKCSTN